MIDFLLQNLLLDLMIDFKNFNLGMNVMVPDRKLSPFISKIRINMIIFNLLLDTIL